MVVHAWYRDGSASGENRVVEMEVDQLRRAGHEVIARIVDNAEFPGPSLAAKARAPIDAIYSLSARRDLEKAISRNRPDVVHVHNVFPTLSPSVLAAGRSTGVPVVATLHNYRPLCAKSTLFRDGAPCRNCFSQTSAPAIQHACADGSRARSAIMAAHVDVNRALWRHAPTLLLPLSRSMGAEFVRAGFPADRLIVKGNAVPDEPASRAAEPRAITFIGRLVEAKGIDILRQAWQRVTPVAESMGVHLAIAGVGPMNDDVADWASSNRSVRFLGRRSPQECSELIAESIAVVVPSAWPEPFGLAAIEAMRGSVPPVAPNDGAFPDMLTDGVTGFLYRQRDPSALASTIELLLRDRDLAERAGEAARRTYEMRFTPEANVAALESAYRRAIDLVPNGVSRK